MIYLQFYTKKCCRGKEAAMYMVAVILFGWTDVFVCVKDGILFIRPALWEAPPYWCPLAWSGSDPPCPPTSNGKRSHFSLVWPYSGITLFITASPGRRAIFKGMSPSQLLWWYLVVMVFDISSTKLIVQMCRHTHLFTSQCQGKGNCQNPQPSKRDSLDFKKELIRWHNGTQCAQTAVGTTQADTKKGLKTEALQLTVSFVACSMVHTAPASEVSTYTTVPFWRSYRQGLSNTSGRRTEQDSDWCWVKTDATAPPVCVVVLQGWLCVCHCIPW